MTKPILIKETERMLKLPQQDYIKYLYENEDLSINEISKTLGVNWRTAQKYAYKEDWNLPIKGGYTPECKVMTDEYKSIIDTILQEDLMAHRKQRHTSKRIFDRLIEEYNFKGAYRTVCTYVKAAKEKMHQKGQSIDETFERLEHPGGEAQIDFCTYQVYKDEVLQDYKLLVMSFPYSNKAFIQPMPAENQECFLEGLKMLFEKCEAVPRRLWFDNLSAAVISHTPSEQHTNRTLTEAFVRFRAHYGFDAVFCGAGKGNEKGNVENKCGYSRRNWCVPIPCFKDFKTLTVELDARALADAKREHYCKEGTIETRFEEEKVKLLKLPETPYEVVKLSSAILNKYSEITIDKHTYKVFKGTPNQTVIIKTYWDHVELLTEMHLFLEDLPRPYTFKPQEIKWLEVFRNYTIKPKTYAYSQFKKMLPEVIQNYLNKEETLQKERLQAIYHWLGNYTLQDILKVIEHSSGGETTFVLSQRLAVLNGKPHQTLVTNDPYTPINLQNRVQDLSVYDALTKKGGTKVCH